MAGRRFVQITAPDAAKLAASPDALIEWKRTHLVDPDAWTATLVEHAWGKAVVLDHADPETHPSKHAALRHGGRQQPRIAGMMVNAQCRHGEGCGDESIHGTARCAKHVGT